LRPSRPPFGVRYKTKTGKDLQEVRAELKPGDWWYDATFSLLGYAQEWGVKPSFLKLCAPEDDPWMMLAYSKVKNSMSAYDAQKQMEEMDRKARRKGKR
jgi:hypothetical protein